MDQPRDANDVTIWLRQYYSWAGQLAAGGLQTVHVEGTRVQSGRTGDPTGGAAAWLAVHAGRVRTVETWLRTLDGRRRILVEWWLVPAGCVGIEELADRTGMPLATAWRWTKGVPMHIWMRHYARLTE